MLGLRDYQDAKADVILKYNADEARNLKTYGELPESGMSMWFESRDIQSQVILYAKWELYAISPFESL